MTLITGRASEETPPATGGPGKRLAGCYPPNFLYRHPPEFLDVTRITCHGRRLPREKTLIAALDYQHGRSPNGGRASKGVARNLSRKGFEPPSGHPITLE